MVLSTHSIRQFPLHFPSRASPCAITFQLASTRYRNVKLQGDRKVGQPQVCDLLLTRNEYFGVESVDENYGAGAV
jgi:hypothetical protein